jgi:hypothetical protein
MYLLLAAAVAVECAMAAVAGQEVLSKRTLLLFPQPQQLASQLVRVVLEQQFLPRELLAKIHISSRQQDRL